MPLRVDIVTRERALITRMADMVILPGIEGQMGVLEGHAPLLSTLDFGEIVLHHGDNTEYIAVSGGVVEVRPDKVTVLANAAEHADEIDIERAEAAMARAQALLESTPPPQRRPVMIAALKKSTWRVRVARRRQSQIPGATRSGAQDSSN